jgi:hypothetical protein
VVAFQIGEHAHGDAYTGGGQRSAHEQSRQQRQIEQPVTDSEAQHKRRDEAQHRNPQRSQAGGDQPSHIGLQPHLEQQHDDADFRQQPDGIGEIQPTQHTGAQYHPCQQFADHCRHLHTHRKFGEQARCNQDGH